MIYTYIEKNMFMSKFINNLDTSLPMYRKMKNS